MFHFDLFSVNHKLYMMLVLELFHEFYGSTRGYLIFKLLADVTGLYGLRHPISEVGSTSL